MFKFFLSMMPGQKDVREKDERKMLTLRGSLMIGSLCDM